MPDRRAYYPPCHPAMLTLAALVAASPRRCDPFPELEAVATRNFVAVGFEEFDESAAMTGQPYCRALDLYVDRETKRSADALGGAPAGLPFGLTRANAAGPWSPSRIARGCLEGISFFFMRLGTPTRR